MTTNLQLCLQTLLAVGSWGNQILEMLSLSTPGVELSWSKAMEEDNGINHWQGGSAFLTKPPLIQSPLFYIVTQTPPYSTLHADHYKAGHSAPIQPAPTKHKESLTTAFTSGPGKFYCLFIMYNNKGVCMCVHA